MPVPDVDWCPRCEAPRVATAEECPCCGVVYAKALARARLQFAAPAGQPPEAPPPASAGEPLAGRLAVDPVDAVATESAGVSLVARVLLWCALVWATFRFATHSVASNYAGESVLHLVNLVFHEAGHVLFAVFGQFMTVLGGSIAQVMVPLCCAVALFRARDVFGALVTTWWAGESLVDVAPYVNDARALRLVLLGGRTGAEVEGHDWEFILQSLGWLHLDHTIAKGLHAAGLMVMIGALGTAAVVLVAHLRTSRARP